MIHECHNWVQANHGVFRLVFLVFFAATVALDLWLVLVRQTKSISLRTWEACAAHPTLIAAGMMAGVGIAYLLAPLSGTVLLILLLGVLIGHLFGHY